MSQNPIPPPPIKPSPPPSGRLIEQPEKLSTLLAEDRSDNCLPCKLIGASAFIGLGAYSYFSGQYQLRQQQARILKSGSRFGIRSRRIGISSISAALVGMGIWRLIN